MTKWWENYDWRFVQTNLREIDMADIDANQFVSSLKEFHTTVVMINTSGIIASYPTNLPYHYQSPYLTGDSLQTIIRVCHENDIKVMARTDFSKIRRAIYEAHPDWAYIDLQGEIVDYEGDVHVCLNSDYQQKFALEIIKETLETLDVDGIFFNMGGYVTRDYSSNYHGVCQCNKCKKLFHEKTGFVLPEIEDINDPIFLEYQLFKKETTDAYNRKVCEFIKSIRPDILINHDTYTEESGFIRQESNTALDRPLPHWQYSGSENTKWVRGSYPSYISSNTTVDFIDFPARHVAVSPYQQALRLYQNLANGGSLDYYLMGRLDNHADRSGYDDIKKVFSYHQQNQSIYRDLHADCEIVVLTGDHWGGHGNGDMSEFFGIYRVLTESHQLFDVMIMSRLVNVGLSKYKYIIVPDLEDMDDEAATVIDQAVNQGKILIATGKTGFRDERFKNRNENALPCLRFVKHLAERKARGAYFEISQQNRVNNLENTDLVAVDGNYLYAEYPAQSTRFMKLLPPQPFGPPERCYPLYPASDYPAFVANRYGQGQVIYIPWNPGRLFHRQGYKNTFDFLTDVFEQVCQMKPVAGNIPPTVEVTLLVDHKDQSRTLHFVNNNGHFGNSFYHPSAISNIKCSIIVQKDAVDSVTSLISGKLVEYSFSQHKLTLAIDRIDCFEALLIR